MSPEQLQGREVTVRSDIYALGLLIYELVTGRRAFEGKGLAELTRKHRDERPIEPSAIVPDLDPAVERTILACLEKDPKRRPPSALVVSAMLAGRDPLEAAIAAGETPSPELVAAAGEAEGLRPRVGVGVPRRRRRRRPRRPARSSAADTSSPRVPVEKRPAALEDRARELLARLGHAAPAADAEVGLLLRRASTSASRPGAGPLRRRAGTACAPASRRSCSFWYRQSPRPLFAARR